MKPGEPLALDVLHVYPGKSALTAPLLIAVERAGQVRTAIAKAQVKDLRDARWPADAPDWIPGALLPVVPATHLGVTRFGQSGDLEDVYRYHHIDTDSIIGAALDLVD